MARTRTTNPADTNTLALKVNDRIKGQLKMLSAVTGVPVSVMLVHYVAAQLELDLVKHETAIKEYFNQLVPGVEATPMIEVAQAAE